jgi:D-serine deaminase-like pyridoxal phosphate-dependent protein
MKFISRPTLILDKDKCIRNIEKMVQIARNNHTEFRPHFKTHQSREVGNWFRMSGVDKIAVSSLSMAKYFLEDGWKNITIAFPLNHREIPLLDQLAAKGEIHQTILSPESVLLLEKQLKNKVNIWIKVDTGYKRTGVIWEDYEIMDSLIELLRKSKKLNLQGFLTHAGHTYKARIREEVEYIYEDSLEKLLLLRDRYKPVFPDLKISYGDTPSCSIIEDLHDIDEIRPGNFVFYDVMQSIVGACKEDEIAVALACPVVSIHPDRNKIVVYAGSVHLSKDSMILHDGTEIFGKVALQEKKAWGSTLPGCYVSSLSQEHGIITVTENILKKTHIGDLIFILPIHSCLTADLMQGYRLANGTGIDHMSGSIQKSWH